MIELIEQFNEERSAVQKPEISIGIGIASGDVVAGYTGTQKRATYTCVGEKVNLAARLEAHTKVARRSILIDERTQRSLKHRVPTDALGAVTFKGKSVAADVYAVTTTQHDRRTGRIGRQKKGTFSRMSTLRTAAAATGGATLPRCEWGDWRGPRCLQSDRNADQRYW